MSARAMRPSHVFCPMTYTTLDERPSLWDVSEGPWARRERTRERAKVVQNPGVTLIGVLGGGSSLGRPRASGLLLLRLPTTHTLHSTTAG